MTQPTWTKLDAGLPANPVYRALEPDPFDPAGRQYLLINNTVTTYDELYVRTGGAWSKIADGSYAGVLVTALKADWSGYDTLFASELGIGPIQSDINTQGYLGLWATADLTHGGWIGRWWLYFHSLDYGVTWHLSTVPMGSAFTGDLQVSAMSFGEVGDFKGTSLYAAGQMLYAPLGIDVVNAGGLFISRDKGDTWIKIQPGSAFNFHEPGGAETGFGTDIYQDIIYAWKMAGASGWLKRSTDEGANWSTDLLGGVYSLTNLAASSAKFRYRFHALLGASTGASILRIVLDNNDILKSTNAGVTWADMPAGSLPANTIMNISLVHDADGKIYGLDVGSAKGVDSRAIWVSDDEGATWVAKAGANAGTPPYTDSIPYGAIPLAILQVWN